VILVDTSVWIEHFRRGSAGLAALLTGGLVLTHPMIVAELVCGNLKNRAAILSHLQALPSAAEASHQEVMRLVSDRRLAGKGIGWIDTHLIASALLSNCPLWTLDRRLVEAAREACVRIHEP